MARLGITRACAQRRSRDISARQEQTRDTFAFKWAKRETYESEQIQSSSKRWLLERYCGNDPRMIDRWLEGGGKIILDAGCGSGYSALLLFGEHLKLNDYLGVDISDAVEIADDRFQKEGYDADFLQADLMDLPFQDGMVDLIFSEGVLHHTDDTKAAVASLSTKLRRGGLFLFYVYAKKAVIREFTDDHVRDQLKDMSDAEAWEALKPFTKLGIALGELDGELEVPDDIPLLGIKKGRVSLQRFVYWNICKLYYRPEFTFDEMHHINFDWFRPLNCHRHTPDEVREFCDSSGLVIEHMDVQESGITVVARKT